MIDLIAKPLMTGSQINQGVGSGSQEAASPEGCFQLAPYSWYGYSSETEYHTLFLWDSVRQCIFSVVTDTFNQNFAAGKYVANPFTLCPAADAEIWAQVKKIVDEGRIRQSREGQHVRDYILSLQAKVGQSVKVVRGRKIPKGTEGVIQRLINNDYGPAVMINGVWTSANNVEPNVQKPAQEYLHFYYDRRSDYFEKGF